ncbi:DUF3016 domain-containing protein [Crenobacter cavernae]|uniref:DUF3016 domain-containing protein n=1 Tax=Crenobacter cavernae TaxID=2290923 RepID=A0ABY0FET8_9NEIS|nr:DUF3016 domain-containing protein [Crenobacter cavernae]RXZ44566.1 DUF3016 domain-containing protein [Crenobacter cavernae]
MRARSLVATLGLFAVLAPAAHSEVTVVFVEPQHYTDGGEGGYRYDRSTLNTLERHLKTLGGRCLKEGETLVLRVLDVDLAGRYEWWRRAGYDVRVMRDITWPRLDLEYVWRDASGRVLGQARERVSDMSYLWRSPYVRNDLDPLPYEKAMLRDWFDRRFCRG